MSHLEESWAGSTYLPNRALVHLTLPLLALDALPWPARPTSGQLRPAPTPALAPARRGTPRKARCPWRLLRPCPPPQAL